MSDLSYGNVLGMARSTVIGTVLQLWCIKSEEQVEALCIPGEGKY